MLLEKIKLGKTLEIYVDREGYRYRYRFVSKVEETSTRRVCVTLIAANGRAFKFRPEDNINIMYRDEEQMWEWEKVKAGIAKLDNDPVHFFQIIDKGHSFNRRNAFRIPFAEEIEIRYYNQPDSTVKLANPMEFDKEELGEEEYEKMTARYSRPKIVKAMVKDLSENGIGFYSDCDFIVDDGISFEIPTKFGNLGCSAVAIRKLEIKSSANKYKFYYGCVFSKTDKKLIKLIYDVQRELLKKKSGM